MGIAWGITREFHGGCTFEDNLQYPSIFIHDPGMILSAAKISKSAGIRGNPDKTDTALHEIGKSKTWQHPADMCQQNSKNFTRTH